MKTEFALIFVMALGLSTGLGVAAADFTKGVVQKVNLAAKKVTIAHEALIDLGMPAMTMVFRTIDDSMLENMEPGEEIEFIVDRVNGKLTIVEVK